jgi:hypothetical protein
MAFIQSDLCWHVKASVIAVGVKISSDIKIFSIKLKFNLESNLRSIHPSYSIKFIIPLE